MIKSIFILTSLILLSCGSKPTATTRYESDAEASSPSNQEDFDEFFKKFTTDSLFQIERVKFPWRLRIAVDDGETVEETSKEDWTHSTFYYEESYASRQTDAYTQEIKTYGDTVILELRGVDNGIHIDYSFARDNGKWILVSGKDYSN